MVDTRFRVPTGWMVDPNNPEAIIPIPGGEADANRAAAIDKAAKRAGQEEATAGIITDDIDRALAIHRRATPSGQAEYPALWLGLSPARIEPTLRH